MSIRSVLGKHRLCSCPLELEERTPRAVSDPVDELTMRMDRLKFNLETLREGQEKKNLPKVSTDTRAFLLPQALMQKVFSHLNVKDLSSVARACSQWTQNSVHALYLSRKASYLSTISFLSKKLSEMNRGQIQGCLKHLSEFFHSEKEVHTFQELREIESSMRDGIIFLLKRLTDKELDQLALAWRYERKPTFLVRPSHVRDVWLIDLIKAQKFLEEYQDTDISFSDNERERVQPYLELVAEYDWQLVLEWIQKIPKERLSDAIVQGFIDTLAESSTLGMSVVFKLLQEVRRLGYNISFSFLSERTLDSPQEVLGEWQGRLTVESCPQTQAKLWMAMSLVQLMKGQIDLAVTTTERLLALGKETLEHESVSFAFLSHMKWIIRELCFSGDVERVMPLIDKVLNSFQEAADPLLSQVGCFFADLGCHENAFSVSRRIVDEEVRSSVVEHSVEVLLACGDLSQAVGLVRKGLSLEDQISRLIQISEMYEQRGQLDCSVRVVLSTPSSELRDSRCRHLLDLLSDRKMFVQSVQLASALSNLEERSLELAKISLKLFEMNEIEGSRGVAERIPEGHIRQDTLDALSTPLPLRLHPGEEEHVADRG